MPCRYRAHYFRDTLPVICLALFLFLPGMSVSADSLLDSAEFYRSIIFPPVNHPHPLAIELTPELAGHCGKNLDHVVVINQANLPEPSVIRSEYHPARRISVPSEIMSSGSHTSRESIIRILSPDAVHNEIILDCPGKPFKSILRISAGDDGENWTVIREEALIFEPDACHIREACAVEYPDSTCRFLKIRCIGPDVFPGVNRVSVWRKTPPKTKYITVSVEDPVSIRTEPGKAVYLFHRQQSFPAISRIRFKASAENYFFVVRVYSGIDEDSMRLLTDGWIYEQRMGSVEKRKTYIDFQPVFDKCIRVEIIPEIGAVSGFSSLAFQSVLHRLVFIAAPRETYRLFYGGRCRNSVSGKRLSSIRSADIAVARLGPEKPNPAFHSTHSEHSEPWMVFTLWMILAGGVIWCVRYFRQRMAGV